MKWTKTQKNIFEDTGNLLVSASAGSGKTTVMIEKILMRLREGYDIRRILLMTFSKASAADMKEKLIKKLFEEIRENKGNVANLKKQVDLLNFSNICTIDSFCFNLYKKYFAAINYEPAYNVLDPKESKMIFVRCIEDTVEEYLEKRNDEDFFSFIERFTKSRDVGPLKETINVISEFLDNQINENEFIDKVLKENDFDKSLAIKEYLNHYRKKAKMYLGTGKNLFEESKKENMPPIYIDIINSITGFLEKVINSKDIKEFFESFEGVELANIPTKKPKDFCMLELHDEIRIFKSNITTFASKINGDYENDFEFDKELSGSKKDIDLLLEMTKEARKKFIKEKIKVKKFDFSDLIRVALLILAKEEIRKEIQNSFDFIFVDEYQDTSFVQEKMLELIKKDNNLFVVGDIKQSIYQFRKAEPKIFIDRLHKYENGQNGKIEKMNDNFRSNAKILNFVNDVFSQVMSEDFGGVDYRMNSRFHTDIPFDENKNVPAVEIMVYEKTKKDKKEQEQRKIYSVKENTIKTEETDIEKDYIIAKIKSLVGKEFLNQQKTGSKKLIDYNDIAILVKKKNSAKNIIRELEKEGMPFIAIDFDNNKMVEKEILVDLLRIIDNFTSDIPLASIMQSPIFNFSQIEMLEIRKNSTKTYFWESVLCYKGNLYIENKINFMKYEIEKYKNMSFYCNVYELMMRILQDGYDAYLMHNGEGKLELVNKFINNIKGKDYAKNIQQFLDFYDNVYKNDENVSSFGNAIRIMTIHKSKGLEFPIVFIAKANDKYSNGFVSKEDICMDSELGVSIKYFDTISKSKKDTIFTKGFKIKKENQEREEFLRTMYVAMTRAKNHLFIVGERPGKTAEYPEMMNSFLEWIFYAKEKDNLAIEKYIKEYQAAGNKEKEKEICSFCKKELDFSYLENKYKYENTTNMPIKYTVTALNEDNKENYEYEKVPYLFEEENKRLEKGIIIHKLLEKLDYDKNTEKEIREQINYLVENNVISSENLEGIDIKIFEKVFNSEIIQYARKNKYYKEKAFMLYLPYCEIVPTSKITDKVLVQGVIDLLILGEENVVVDFKITNSNEEILKERYKNQLNLYALAIEKILGKKIHRKCIYIINKNKIINL